MEQILGKFFIDQFVRLDYKVYKKCSFIGCTIHAETGNFGLIDCDFSNCKLSLGEPALKIANLIKRFYPDMPFWIEGEETKEQVLLKMKERLQKEGLI